AAAAQEAAAQAAADAKAAAARQVADRSVETAPAAPAESTDAPAADAAVQNEPPPSEAPATDPPPETTEPRKLPSSPGAATAVEWARAQLGKPYEYGANGPDTFDCSGLVQYVWGKAGVQLSHAADAQYSEGTPVSRDELQPGD